MSPSERSTQAPLTLGQAVLAARPARVLLAEDDTELRTLLATCLRQDGYCVVEAKDGDELLQEIGDGLLAAYSVRPDLIVSDIRMPGRSGIDVLAGLRDAAWETPVVLVTAFGDEETHARAKALGATAILDKPFDVDDLRTVVLLHLSRSWRRYGPESAR